MKDRIRRHRNLIIAVVAVAALAVILLAVRPDAEPAPVPYNRVAAAVEEGTVDTARIDDTNRVVTVTLKDGSTLSANYPDGAGEKISTQLVDADVTVTVDAPKSPSLLASLLATALPLLLVLGVLVWYMRSRVASPSRFGKGRGEASDVPDITLADVAGCDEVVEELREVVELFHDTDRYAHIGARLPRGFLLEGPPGTGKTLLAKAVAGEAGVPFFPMAGSDFVETYVGVGAARVRALFAQARKAGSAVIFFDEIDALARARGTDTGNGHPGDTERESTLNALLVELDGFADNANIVVMAATNRVDMLDPAVLRPGRFDRRITVPAPDRAGRHAILALHARRHTLADDVDLASVARRTTGLAGADLESMLNQAALVAARSGATAIGADHLDEALATTVMGRERRGASLTERDRAITAWHEAGHALCALLQDDTPDPVAVTVVPRGSAGGVTWLDAADDSFFTHREASARLVVMMGGRAAEEILLGGDFSQGAQSDFASATNLATQMVTTFGMSRLGPAVRTTPGSPAQADAVAAEVDHILEAALSGARDLLERHAVHLAAVSDALLEDETLSVEQLRDIVATPAAD